MHRHGHVREAECGRLALEVLAAGAGPLLIFAPQRANAEKIARQLAKEFLDRRLDGLEDVLIARDI